MLRETRVEITETVTTVEITDDEAVVIESETATTVVGEDDDPTVVEVTESPTVVEIAGETVTVVAAEHGTVTLLTDLVSGADGTDGTDGTEGLSAYDVAVLNGFVGTEAEWLASLQGPPGTPGGTLEHYTHNQVSASAVWTIVHNLGFNPGGIISVDSGGTEWEGDVVHIDVNTLTITFTTAFGGKAYVS